MQADARRVALKADASRFAGRVRRSSADSTVINLLTNAIPATPREAIIVRGAQRLKGGRVLSGYYGAGIPRGHFVQSSSRSCDAELAAGRLGLGSPRAADCRGAGGRLTVQSEHGRGSTFSFTVPVGTGLVSGDNRSADPATGGSEVRS
jgi:hypothetical protein